MWQGMAPLAYADYCRLTAWAMQMSILRDFHSVGICLLNAAACSRHIVVKTLVCSASLQCSVRVLKEDAD